jgi:hypothetical protein
MLIIVNIKCRLNDSYKILMNVTKKILIRRIWIMIMIRIVIVFIYCLYCLVYYYCISYYHCYLHSIYPALLIFSLSLLYLLLYTKMAPDISISMELLIIESYMIMFET